MELRCSDLGMANCPYVARGGNEDEVLDNIMDHADDMHGENLEGKSEGQLRNEWRKYIKK